MVIYFVALVISFFPLGPCRISILNFNSFSIFFSLPDDEYVTITPEVFIASFINLKFSLLHMSGCLLGANASKKTRSYFSFSNEICSNRVILLVKEMCSDSLTGSRFFG